MHETTAYLLRYNFDTNDMNNYVKNIFKQLFSITLLLTFSLIGYTQGIPEKVTYEPDEGGYEGGYTPIKKLGTFDLSSNATNEPFRHLLWGGTVPWDKTVDYRDFGFKAMWGDAALYKPKVNRYLDLNEVLFRNGNPVYSPDPNAVGAGQTFTCVNAPFPNVTIDNIAEDSKWNPFLLSQSTIDNIARSAGNPTINFHRWDIESFNHESWQGIIKGRQVWEGGKYRHQINGGSNPEFKDMDDPGFFYYVQNRWGYVFSELFYKTKFYGGGKIKIWMYGWGPIGKAHPGISDQFDVNGKFHPQWTDGKFIWRNKNNINNKSVSETLDYMEPWDIIPTNGTWGIAQQLGPTWWYSTDIILLDKAPQDRVTSGKPTRFSITDLGDAGMDNAGYKKRRVRISLRAQDGTLRLSDKDNLSVFFQDWHGDIKADIPKGQHTIEMTVYTWSPLLDGEDDILILCWNNMYCQRYQEPQKLGFVNWEPTPRTEGLFTTSLFSQRVYDAMIAFTNLQNYGIVHWEGNTVGWVNGAVRESLILANKKIAPYKSHIENQVLCQAGVSLDNGSSWTEGGYPTKPFEQCYNGWWMRQKREANAQFPILLATYNAQQRTVLIAHLTNRMDGNLSYKVRVKIPNVGNYVFDLTSNKSLKYTMFRI